MRPLARFGALAATVAVLLVAACQPGPSPVAVASATPTPWHGWVGATFTRLDGIPATPDPIAATDVSGQAGPVSLVRGVDRGRALEIRVADAKPPQAGTSYTVVAPADLDATGASPGASLTYTDGKGGTWASTDGRVAVALVAGAEVDLTFQGVVMSPQPGNATGGFNFDGQAQAILASPPPSTSPSSP